MFKEKTPIAWSYHKNTERWSFNLQKIADPSGSVAPFKEYLNAAISPLPKPAFPTTSLLDAIRMRLSCRNFSGDPLTLSQLSNILYAGYGIQDKILLGDMEFLERTVPSGGGLYPLELYVINLNAQEIEPGIYHYSVLQHSLEQLKLVSLPKQLITRLFMEQTYITKSSVIIVIAAALARSLWKYGDRGYRYILFEAGHAAQNINLVTAAMELGCLNLGGFFDGNLARLLDLDTESEIPLYCIAVGVPSAGDRASLRGPIE